MQLFMGWATKDSLTEAEIRDGLQTVIKDSIASQMVIGLTTGAFLVAFALQLGASNTVVGLLAAVPPLVQLVQIPTVYLIERIKLRRPITFFACFASRTCLLFIGLAPFVFPPETVLSVLIGGLIAYGIFAAMGTCAWNAWMRDLIPHPQLGQFNARRLTVATFFGTVLTLGAGYFLDRFTQLYPQQEVFGYSALFVLAFLVGMIDEYFIATVPEPRMKSEQTGILKLILLPFRDTNFRNLLRYLFTWNFALNLAAPFFTVYMLTKLDMDMSSVIGLTVLSQLMNLLFFRVWGRLLDQYSNKSILNVCAPMLIVCILLWTFTRLPEKHALTVPLLIGLHVFMGISMAGTTLGALNIAVKLAPKNLGAAYLAASSLANSLAAGLAPVLGGFFADYFASRQLSLVLRWSTPHSEVAFDTLHFEHWDFFFFMAFVVGLYSIYRLAKVKEEGDVKSGVIVRELVVQARRQMRNFSSVGGLRLMTQFPFSLVRPRNRDKNCDQHG